MDTESNNSAKNPQAFPTTYHDKGIYLRYKDGMTLRDYFAAKALQGFLANNYYAESQAKRSGDIDERVTERSFKIADAMLKARQ